MATVYLARVSGVGGFQRFVAIKRLHPHLAREPEFIEMFLDEARLAARIHHPNVVSILEIGASEQGYYIVMEYVEGDTLGRLLSRAAQTGQRLPLEVGLRIVVDMLSGLEAAHELTDDDGNPLLIVHRDVSPQNVLVGVDGNARLTDFGVARATSRLSVTRSGQLKGKVAYMAPEQARGDGAIDHRADVFAAGVVLWEVLAGRRLFKGDGEAQTLNKVLSDTIPSVQSVWPAVPAALEAIAAKALERDRTARYQSALELAEDIETASRGLGVHGTTKDVASYLDSALGPEITSQREAVRAWVARSDPGRRSYSQTPPPVRVSEGLPATRIERKGKVGSVPPGPPSVSGVASLPAPPRLPSLAAPPAAASNASGPHAVVVSRVVRRRAQIAGFDPANARCPCPRARGGVALAHSGGGRPGRWPRMGSLDAEPAAGPCAGRAAGRGHRGSDAGNGHRARARRLGAGRSRQRVHRGGLGLETGAPGPEPEADTAPAPRGRQLSDGGVARSVASVCFARHVHPARPGRHRAGCRRARRHLAQPLSLADALLPSPRASCAGSRAGWLASVRRVQPRPS